MMPTRGLTSSLAFPVLSFSAPPGLGPSYCAAACLQIVDVRNPPGLSPLSRHFSLPMMFLSRFFAWCSVLSNFCIRLSPFPRHPFVTLPFAFVIIRLLMFCAFELLNSYLSSSSTSILNPSATARLLSICELPLLATAVTAFIARLFLGSESGGIGTSFDSCCAANSPAVLTISPLPQTFLSTAFASASLNTSLLRSGHFAPFGVVLRRSSILARQKSE